jgi:hypothetical protein
VSCWPTDRRFGYRAGDRPHDDPDAIDEPGVRGGSRLQNDGRGVGREVEPVLCEALESRLVLEHDQLAVGLAPGLQAKRSLGQVRITDVLALLVDDTPAVGAASPPLLTSGNRA